MACWKEEWQPADNTEDPHATEECKDNKDRRSQRNFGGEKSRNEAAALGNVESSLWHLKHLQGTGFRHGKCKSYMQFAVFSQIDTVI